MSDTKKYYYLKLIEGFFDTDEMKVIESMPNGYKYSNILLKMYLKSLKREGKLMVTDCIPYDLQALATVVGHDEDTVKRAIEIFSQYQLIIMMDSGAIFMTQIQNFIGKSSTEADRKREYRAKIEAEKLGLLPEGETPLQPDQPPQPPSGTPATPSRTPNCPYGDIVSIYEEKCTKLPKVRELTDKRKKTLLGVWKIHPNMSYFDEVFSRAGECDFLSGKNDRKWKADFDFIINPNNIAKLLEGKYDNKEDTDEPESPRPPQNAFELLKQRRAARG
jgi:phage replisome organizer, putative, N-terminal region